MKQFPKMMLLLLLYTYLYGQEKIQIDALENKTRIFLIIDISESNYYSNLNNDFKKVIDKLYLAIVNTVFVENRDDIKLILYARDAKLFEYIQFRSINTLEDLIDYELRANIEKSYPNSALKIVAETAFQEQLTTTEKGIIIIISDGDDTRNDKLIDENEVIHSDTAFFLKTLKYIGYEILPIFNDSMQDKFTSKTYMESLSRCVEQKLLEIDSENQDSFDSMAVTLSTSINNFPLRAPVPREDFIKVKAQYFEEVEKYSVLLNFIFFALCIIFMILIITTIYKLIHKKIYRVNYLWGIIEAKSNEQISLQNKSVPYSLKNGNEVICQLKPIYYKRKKAIDIIDLRSGIECKNNGNTIEIITSELSEYIFYDKDNNVILKINYKFINEFNNGIHQPALIKNFIGRKSIIKYIVNNFKRDKPSSIIISGHGNIGKTSLVKYLHEKINDIECYNELNDIGSKYNTSVLNFENYLGDLDNELKEIRNKLDNSEKNMILFIDDYDLFYEKFKESFINFISGLEVYVSRKDTSCFLVFVGRSHPTVLDKKLEKPNIISKAESYVLSGLDIEYSLKRDKKVLKIFSILTNIVPNFILELVKKKTDSLELINNCLNELGLKSELFSKQIKKLIIDLSNSNPFLIKKIICKIIEFWINWDFNKEISEKDILLAASCLKGESTNDIIARIVKLSGKNSSETYACYKILNCIAKHKGKISDRKLHKRLKDVYGKIENENKLYNARKVTLKNLGLLEKKGRYIYGIPKLIFMDGSPLFNDEEGKVPTINRNSDISTIIENLREGKRNYLIFKNDNVCQKEINSQFESLLPNLKVLTNDDSYRMPKDDERILVISNIQKVLKDNSIIKNLRAHKGRKIIFSNNIYSSISEKDNLTKIIGKTELVILENNIYNIINISQTLRFSKIISILAELFTKKSNRNKIIRISMQILFLYSIVFVIFELGEGIFKIIGRIILTLSATLALDKITAKYIKNHIRSKLIRI